jgi:hypothetical protein
MPTPTTDHVIFLGAGEVCVAASTHIETNTPSLTFRRLEKPAEPGSLLTPGEYEVENFLSIVVVATRPAAQVLHAAATAILARFPATEGEKVTDAQTVVDLLSERDRLREELVEAKSLVSERESRLANIKFLLEPIYGSTNYAPIGGVLDRVLNICDRT